MAIHGVRRSAQSPMPVQQDDRVQAPSEAPEIDADVDGGLTAEDRLLQDLFERGGSFGDLLASRGVGLPAPLPRDLAAIPLPGVARAPAGAASLEERVGRALGALVGADVDAMVLSSSVVKGAAHVEAFVAGSTLRLTLQRDKQGADRVSDLSVAEPPMLADPVQTAELEEALERSGKRGARVLAVADSDPFAVRSTVVVEQAGKKQALVVDRAGGAPKIGPVKLDEDEARSLALPLAVDAALSAARARGAVAEVSVYVRADAMTPADLVLVKGGKSPVRFDPAREVQLAARGLVDDKDVYVTFDKAKGAVRVDAA